VIVNHSDDAFHFSSRVTGIPKVTGLVTQLIEQEQRKQQASANRRRAAANLDRIISQKKWSEALAVVDDFLGKEADSADLLRKKFRILAVGLKDRTAALACGEALFKKLHTHANALNSFAWALLTEGQYGGDYSELALQFSERSNEITKLGTWQYVDTLALAKFETGDAEKAVELEKKAIELSGGSSAAELQAALARFEKGVQ
jgi:tetratricopeptide (TPR) repeat protein